MFHVGMGKWGSAKAGCSVNGKAQIEAGRYLRDGGKVVLSRADDGMRVRIYPRPRVEVPRADVTR